ncbi:MAG: exopolysaccharide biosynthesis protein [Verrucomicrobia bacterium]|nr:exopolysaccharide biosynthesis protein [Verrucomicrobiota bacterium]
MHHVPLSQNLEEILAGPALAADFTVARLLERTHGRGLYLVIVFFCLPFIMPISIPGFSTLCGLVIGFLALGLALRLPPWLPRFIAARPLSSTRLHKVLRGSVKVLRFVEKWIKPRRSAWMAWRPVQVGNALAVAFFAALLALPIPPLIPFTNMLPSYAIIVIAVSMMEEDGVMIWAGYTAGLGTIAYFAFCAEKIAEALAKLLGNAG